MTARNLASARSASLAAKRAAAIDPTRKTTLQQIEAEGREDYEAGAPYSNCYRCDDEMAAYLAGWNAAYEADMAEIEASRPNP